MEQYAPQLADLCSNIILEDLLRVETVEAMLYESIVEDAADYKKGIRGIPTTRIQRFIEAVGRKNRLIDSLGLTPVAKAKMHRDASDADKNRAELAGKLREGLEEGARLRQRAIDEGRYIDVEPED